MRTTVRMPAITINATNPMIFIRGTSHARRIYEVTVTLDRDRQPAAVLVGECSAHRSRRAVADSGAARPPEMPIGLVEIPEPHRTAADVAALRDQRPILVLDLRPQ